MSSTLSIDTKDALARELPSASHCREALLHGLLIYGVSEQGFTFSTQRLAVARLLKSLLDADPSTEPQENASEHPIRKKPSSRQHASYEIAGPFASFIASKKPSARCDRRQEIRAAFLACGSIAEPHRGYHLEFTPPTPQAAERLIALLHGEGLTAKHILRKKRTVVYFKGIDEITQVLSAIGAFNAVLHLEDVRALKETKNRIHRLVNTEAANVDRASKAAAQQRELIDFLVDTQGLHALSPILREIAELRLAYPTETLAEIGRRCDPPIGKSTVNARFATLKKRAKRRKNAELGCLDGGV